MSFLRDRLLPATLVVILGIGAGAPLAMADSGQRAGHPAGQTAGKAAGKARVAQGVIVTHAASKLGNAEWAKKRPHYNELKPRVRTNTE